MPAAFVKAFGNECHETSIFRTDNGSDFEGCFAEYLLPKGIFAEKSLPGRPSTNSKIEDKVKRVCQTARAAMEPQQIGESPTARLRVQFQERLPLAGELK